MSEGRKKLSAHVAEEASEKVAASMDAYGCMCAAQYYVQACQLLCILLDMAGTKVAGVAIWRGCQMAGVAGWRERVRQRFTL